MTDDRDLEGLDPYDLMDSEAGRLDRFFIGGHVETLTRRSPRAVDEQVTCD